MENELGIPCYGALMIMRRGKILDTRDLTRGSRLTQPYRTRDPGPPGHPGGLARWVDEFQSCFEFRGRTGQGSRLISGGGLRAPCIF